MKKIILFQLGLFLLLASSCTTTKVTSSWVSPSRPSNVMEKVLVVGVMADREIKEKTEKAMVAELQQEGINASSAMELLGPKGFQGQTEEQIAQKLRGSSYTSVMIVSVQAKEKESRWVPGSYYSYPYYGGGYRYYRRYMYLYDNMYTPGYYTTTTNYVLVADIYTVNDDDELIYAAQTSTYDPNNINSLASSFAKSIVNELQANGLVRNR